MLVAMQTSDLRHRPDRITGGDWWLVEPRVRRRVILAGLVVIAALTMLLVALRPAPADAGGDRIRGYVGANEAASQVRAADSAPLAAEPRD